jgi:hypothetical protein
VDYAKTARRAFPDVKEIEGEGPWAYLHWWGCRQEGTPSFITLYESQRDADRAAIEADYHGDSATVLDLRRVAE